jgi:glyoxylase-like metal-dependent hydrolase (beta-lactamase superfamily II)
MAEAESRGGVGTPILPAEKSDAQDHTGNGHGCHHAGAELPVAAAAPTREHELPRSTMRQEKLPPEDDAVEVAPGVVRLQLTIALPGLGHVNCYAIEDDRGVALVDPGLPGRKPWNELVRRLKAAGMPIERVHTVLITHSHPDHFGAAGHIRRVTGAEVITHADFKTFFDPAEEDDDEKELADPHDLDGWAAAKERLVRVAEAAGREAVARGRQQIQQWQRWNGTAPWGGPHPRPPRKAQYSYAVQQLTGLGYFRPPKPSTRVIDGQSIMLGGHEWLAVHTPGHTVDHLCLLDPANGTFISGDHVLPTITPHISGLVRAEDPLRLYFDSLQRLLEFDDVRTVLPAHGMAFDNLHERCTEIQHHHHGRLDLLRLAGEDLGEAPVSAWSERLFKPAVWGPMADSETYAHLEHLVRTGEAVRREIPGDGLRYRLVG